ncbi:hypothetical protein SLEP1_g46516 [Rubroshorea leprosula]|uniref:Bet v I/Major latex protein domain-containing protein n=1 Tax=Rubroshorea leprosula TaxID=152421 RepID=A0AAV5LN30_9ROSI|nr:hypothetical protein SLEP1_g46516 [Rubroshorea leprosula]
MKIAVVFPVLIEDSSVLREPRELGSSQTQALGFAWSRPHHISKVTPDNIQGVELHEGEWGAEGSVICWSYVHGKAEFEPLIVEAIDLENNSIAFRVIEGDLMKEYKSFLIKIDVTPKGEGSVTHWTLEYEKLNEDVAHPETLMEFCAQVSKEIVCHLTITQA